MSKRALIVASVASHIKQFCMDDANILIGLGYKVEIAANFCAGNAIDNESLIQFQNLLTEKGIVFHQIDFVRTMTDLKGHYHSLKTLEELLDRNHYDIVHCHTPIAGAICRFAVKKYRTAGTRVVYTAHGFHFYKGAPLRNWVLFYPIEKICSRWTDVLITINKEDYSLAKNAMKANDIEYVSGVGIDLTKFYPNKFDESTISSTRLALGLEANDKMLLSVGELTPRKNHKDVIQALAKMADPHLKYYICGCGQLEKELRTLIQTLNLTSNVFLLGYRQDVDLLYACADLFVFPSLQEGLPVALMEALASGLPAIGSDIRGNNELLDQDARFQATNVKEIVGLISSKASSGYEKETYEKIRVYDKKEYLNTIKQIYTCL